MELKSDLITGTNVNPGLSAKVASFQNTHRRIRKPDSPAAKPLVVALFGFSGSEFTHMKWYEDLFLSFGLTTLTLCIPSIGLSWRTSRTYGGKAAQTEMIRQAFLALDNTEGVPTDAPVIIFAISMGWYSATQAALHLVAEDRRPLAGFIADSCPTTADTKEEIFESIDGFLRGLFKFSFMSNAVGSAVKRFLYEPYWLEARPLFLRLPTNVPTAFLFSSADVICPVARIRETIEERSSVGAYVGSHDFPKAGHLKALREDTLTYKRVVETLVGRAMESLCKVHLSGR